MNWFHREIFKGFKTPNSVASAKIHSHLFPQSFRCSKNKFIFTYSVSLKILTSHGCQKGHSVIFCVRFHSQVVSWCFCDPSKASVDWSTLSSRHSLRSNRSGPITRGRPRLGSAPQEGGQATTQNTRPRLPLGSWSGCLQLSC